MSKIITLTESKLTDNISTSTKGNQNKWFDGMYWYKADGLGYESLSEFVVSSLMKYTNISNYVNYSLIKIEYKKNTYTACKSKNFINDEKLITLKKLFMLALGVDVYDELKKYITPKDKIKYIVSNVKKITNLNNFGEYLTTMLELDAFFLNEDRHLNNIAFLRNTDGNFELCPLYDFGASLFSDTMTDYSLDKNYDECLKHIFSKPFSENFDEQCEAAEQLFGVQFEYNFSMKEVDEVLDQAKKYQI